MSLSLPPEDEDVSEKGNILAGTLDGLIPSRTAERSGQLPCLDCATAGGSAKLPGAARRPFHHREHRAHRGKRGTTLESRRGGGVWMVGSTSGNSASTALATRWAFRRGLPATFSPGLRGLRGWAAESCPFRADHQAVLRSARWSGSEVTVHGAAGDWSIFRPVDVFWCQEPWRGASRSRAFFHSRSLRFLRPIGEPTRNLEK